MIKFWWRSGSRIWIRIATLVRRALAGVCTVPVLLVPHRLERRCKLDGNEVVRETVWLVMSLRWDWWRPVSHETLIGDCFSCCVSSQLMPGQTSSFSCVTSTVAWRDTIRYMHVHQPFHRHSLLVSSLEHNNVKFAIRTLWLMRTVRARRWLAGRLRFNGAFNTFQIIILYDYNLSQKLIFLHSL